MKLPPFRIDRYLDGKEAAKYSLAGSVCNLRQMSDVLSLAPGSQDALLKLPLDYQEYTGHPALRETITTLYTDGTTYQPEDVIVTTGAQEAIFALMNALLDPDDHVILQSPYYQILGQIAKSIGCEVTHAMLKAEGGAWTLDFEDIRAAITPQTRMIVLNTPHNPTGYQMPSALLNQIIQLAEQHGIYVVVDEVFRHLEHDPATPLPTINSSYERVIRIGDMSKAYGLPGLRVGWFACTDIEVCQSTLAFKDYMSLTGGAVGQFLANIALQHREQILTENQRLLKHNVQLLADVIARNPDHLAWTPPTAGTIALVQFVKHPSADELAERTYSEADLVLAPGSLFDAPPYTARIGYGSPTFEASILALESYLRAGEVG